MRAHIRHVQEQNGCEIHADVDETLEKLSLGWNFNALGGA